MKQEVLVSSGIIWTIPPTAETAPDTRDEASAQVTGATIFNAISNICGASRNTYRYRGEPSFSEKGQQEPVAIPTLHPWNRVGSLGTADTVWGHRRS